MYYHDELFSRYTISDRGCAWHNRHIIQCFTWRVVWVHIHCSWWHLQYREIGSKTTCVSIRIKLINGDVSRFWLLNIITASFNLSIDIFWHSPLALSDNYRNFLISCLLVHSYLPLSIMTLCIVHPLLFDSIADILWWIDLISSCTPPVVIFMATVLSSLPREFLYRVLSSLILIISASGILNHSSVVKS